jgi:hypothetical protein
MERLNERRRLLWAPVLLVLSLQVLLGVAPIGNATSAPSQSAPSPPPSAVGCYQYDASTGWTSVECVPSTAFTESVADDEGGGTSGPPIYGVSINSPIATSGEVWVGFSKFTAESDSKWGQNSFSIQLNTNVFDNGNSQYWDQFTVQNEPNYINGHSPFAWACIQQLVVYPPPGSDTEKCVNVIIQSMWSTYSAMAEGTTTGGNLQGLYEICSPSGNCYWYSVTATDKYGLAGNWLESSGTVLGFGGRSKASFTSPTQEATDISIGASGLNAANTGQSWDSGESNNLSYSSANYAGCASGSCWEDTTSSN